MTEPIRFREYPSPFNKKGRSGPTCEPDPDLKPEPWLLPDFMFDEDEDEQTEPQSDKTEHTPDASPEEKPADHGQ